MGIIELEAREVASRRVREHTMRLHDHTGRIVSENVREMCNKK